MREQHPCRVGTIISVEKRRCLYKIECADAIEGGGYLLVLMPMQPPYLATSEDVYCDRSGTWRTEQLEVVVEANVVAPAVERLEPVAVAPAREPETPALPGGQLALFEM